MKPLRLAVIGLGRLGRACAEVILDAEDLALAGVVRRPASLALPLPNSLPNVTAVSHFTELDGVDAAIVCVPTEHAHETIIKLLQHRIPVVECATVHGGAFRTRKADIERMAKRHRVAAVLGAGWDPGALSLFRALFALLTPKGHTEITDRPGHSLHHGLAVKAMPGVKDALCAEFPAGNGKIQRYVYVELREGAGQSQRSRRIFVPYPVASLANLFMGVRRRKLRPLPSSLTEHRPAVGANRRLWKLEPRLVGIMNMFADQTVRSGHASRYTFLFHEGPHAKKRVGKHLWLATSRRMKSYGTLQEIAESGINPNQRPGLIPSGARTVPPLPRRPELRPDGTLCPGRCAASLHLYAPGGSAGNF